MMSCMKNIHECLTKNSFALFDKAPAHSSAVTVTKLRFHIIRHSPTLQIKLPQSTTCSKYQKMTTGKDILYILGLRNHNPII